MMNKVEEIIIKTEQDIVKLQKAQIVKGPIEADVIKTLKAIAYEKICATVQKGGS